MSFKKKGYSLDAVSFTVDLRNGTIAAVPHGIIEKGPFETCDSFNMANYYSLGICIQNMNENAFKTQTEINSFNRYIFDTIEEISRDYAVEARKYIKENYTEEFI